MTAPDKYTAQYLLNQVSGFGYWLNSLKAEQASQNETIDALRKDVAKLQVEIGEVNVRYEKLVARLSEKFNGKKGTF